MTTQEQYIERLKEMTATKFGRSVVTTEDYGALSDAIFEEVGIRLDIPSIKHLYTHTSYAISPRPTTLSALAKYVGYASWSDFCTARDIQPAEDQEKIPVVRRWRVIIGFAVAAIALIVMLIVMLLPREEEMTEAQTMYRAVDDRFNAVLSTWAAITTEHCNDLRQYYDEQNMSNYHAHIIECNNAFATDLEARIGEDITRYAVEHNITVDNATIDNAAKAIATICNSMCDNLLYE